ncbi:MAG: hypothetical protein KDJ14_15795 [Xanthomonadales bacterium]|nr:hypothetical protein [Xanthomonadales bacterium]
MATLYDKPVRLLMHDMAASMGLKPGQSFTREQAVQWFAEHYPDTKPGTVTAHCCRSLKIDQENAVLLTEN